MVTIKSYTDLSQSKKLAEILPPESADMAYYQWKDDGHLMSPVPFVLDGMEEKEDGVFEYIPCWSLAALLELLPKRIEIVDNVYKLSVYLYGIYYWNIINGNLCFEAKDKDNLVDACYEAIVFLHEQKLLRL